MTRRAATGRPVVEPTALETLGHAHPRPDDWVLFFPWGKNPVPANGGKGHWRKQAAAERAVRDTAELRIMAAKVPPMEFLRAQVTWWVTDHRVRDPDNLARLEKRMFDAIVRAGVIADDRPELMDKPRGRVRHIGDAARLGEAPVTRACFVLTITRLHQAPDA